MVDTRPGGPKHQLSIKDIAVHLGLSHATVSRALNGNPMINAATAARVRDAAAALGYVRNGAGLQLRGMPGRLVGLIIPDVQNDFYSTVAKVLARCCADQGLQLVLAISEDDSEIEGRHILALIEARIAGVLITPTAGLTERSAELLGLVPTVQLVRSHHAIAASRVVIDDRAATRLATRHLLELGHRAIGFIGGPPGLSTAGERFGGYRDALVEAGRRIDEGLVSSGPPRPEFGQAAARLLWSQPKAPTALVLGSSQLTLGALLAFQELGISLPRDASLVGYGDPPWFRLMHPPVTTLRLPVEELSEAAAAMLIARMTKPTGAPATESCAQSFTPALIGRGTSGRPRTGSHGIRPITRKTPPPARSVV